VIGKLESFVNRSKSEIFLQIRSLFPTHKCVCFNSYLRLIEGSGNAAPGITAHRNAVT